MNEKKMQALMKMGDIFNEIIKSHAEKQGEGSGEGEMEESEEQKPSEDGLESAMSELLGSPESKGQAVGIEIELEKPEMQDEPGYKAKGKMAKEPEAQEVQTEIPGVKPKFARKMK
jgi:hypothetical protein